MKRSFFIKPLRLFFAYFFAISAILAPVESYAIYDGVRDNVSYSTSSYSCTMKEIAYDPFTPNIDLDWELTNPVCITFFLTVGLSKELSDVAVDIACQPTNSFGLATVAQENVMARINEDPWPTLNPFTLLKSGSNSARCTARYTNIGQAAVAQAAACDGPQAAAGAPCAAASTQLALANADAVRCCAAYAVYIAAIGVALATLAVTYGVAKTAYDNAVVCGEEWQQWTKDSDGKWLKGKGPHQLCLEEIFRGVDNDNACSKCSDCLEDSTLELKNKSYREYIYGGIEYEDNGDDACSNPWSGKESEKYLGYTSSNQKYYMTGPGTAPVYACQRFFVAGQDETTQKAYDCCKRRSQNAMCIHSKNLLGVEESLFCEIGSRCEVADVFFDVYASTSEVNYACAKTYSVCPYNHLSGGGTETNEVDPNDLTATTNTCQFMNHCVKLPILPYTYSSTMTGAFISASCKNMLGYSQNVYGYTSTVLPISTRGFSAPMAQCFKETMENLFLNKAGDTKCIDGSEPDSSGVCAVGYEYKEGETLPTQSFFQKIQDNLQDIIKMTLTLSVTFFGFMVLMGVPNSAIAKKQLIPYIVKIALVLYFATGDAWQFGFMDGVLGTSSLMADLTFRVDDTADTSKLDGCQFPRYNYALSSDDPTYYDKYTTTVDPTTGVITVAPNAAYPPGSEYLRIWDTLDCKIARAMGYGPEVSVPNLIFMILGGFLTGGMGIIFVIASFCLAFFMISLTIRALHIFLLSTTAVIILMYISPITITCSLFARTKDIFNNWWKQMLGFTLQPMILFCYLGVLLTLFDTIIVGDVTYTGDGYSAPKEVVCSGDSADTSIYCIFQFANIETFSGLEVLGIGLPMLTGMNSTKLNSIVNAALVMFIFMKFMDQISSFAKNLVGGAELNSGWGSVSQMAAKSYGTLRGIQQRGMRAGMKAGGKVLRKGGELATKGANIMGNRGKSVAAERGASGSDHSSGGTTGSDNAAGNYQDNDNSQSAGGSGADGSGKKDDSKTPPPEEASGKAPEAASEKPSGTGSDNAVSATAASSDSSAAGAPSSSDVSGGAPATTDTSDKKSD